MKIAATKIVAFVIARLKVVAGAAATSSAAIAVYFGLPPWAAILGAALLAGPAINYTPNIK